MWNLALVISAWIRKSRKSHGHRCIVELSNDLDARGVVLNLASFISASIWKFEER